MDEFEGRTAVVTGAASGMGRAFAQQFAELGMQVVLGDIEREPLDRAVAELRESGHEAVGVELDVSRAEDLGRLADVAAERFGNVHLLCNNAGVEGFLGDALWEATDNDWAWTFDVNYWSVVNGLRAFVPGMLAHGEPGHIVNTASMTAVTKPRSLYGVTKFAVLSLTEVLDEQLKAAGANIGVSALCPGRIDTQLFTGSRNRPAALRDESEARGERERRELMVSRLREHGMPPSIVAERLVAAIRLGRLYVLTDHEWDERIRERNEAILDGPEAVAGAPA
jgi:NAD(P)-dependent dehydrogenase (short-subunit alcohol dehydrogenase family)